METLEKLLSELSHLNLEGQIFNKQAHASSFGGSCDVYTAWSRTHGTKVAVKQIRVFMRKDEFFAKVIHALHSTSDRANSMSLLLCFSA